MLLIGSRAIRHFYPEFREPLDWDIVATDADIARLDGSLPRVGETHRRDKAHFRYGDQIVEVANASEVPYWGRMLERFSKEPVLEVPTLGALHLAPPAYLLLTKHCGLVYPVVHWHKNLEDLYFLRDRIPTIPEDIAALLPETVADSRRMFEATQRQRVTQVRPCHPALPDPGDEHRVLHAVLAQGERPACEARGAWQGYPDLPAPERRENLRRLLAEEATVIATEQFLWPRFGFDSQDEAELARWAIRMLAVGSLPDPLRYFVVNHYREIAALVPRGYLERALQRGFRRDLQAEPCTTPGPACSAGAVTRDA